MTDQAAPAFDPGRYLTKVGAADYLEVKWRLLWLRTQHPDASIESELVSLADQTAIFKTTVRIPGGGSATGFGSESYNDFREYIEKAETKSIGRALAALGFGTQFCPDFDFGSANGNVADSPVEFSSTRGRRMSQGNGRAPAPQGNGGTPQLITPRQHKFIEAIAREHGIADYDLDHEANALFGCNVESLSRRDASAFIERLQMRPQSGTVNEPKRQTAPAPAQADGSPPSVEYDDIPF